jgi:hypothetical protein
MNDEIDNDSEAAAAAEAAASEKYAQRVARRDRIASDLVRLRNSGGPARDLHPLKLAAVADRMSFELADAYSLDNLAARVAKLIEASPAVTRAAGAEAAVPSPFTRPELRAMNAADRLAAANQHGHETQEAAAAKARKSDTSAYTPEHLRQMSPSQKLEAARELSRVGVEEPVQRTPSLEEAKALSAERRLSFANLQAAARQKGKK